MTSKKSAPPIQSLYFKSVFIFFLLQRLPLRLVAEFAAQILLGLLQTSRSCDACTHKNATSGAFVDGLGDLFVKDNSHAAGQIWAGTDTLKYLNTHYFQITVYSVGHSSALVN